MSRLHPKQVKGKYYVDNDTCTLCESCTFEAPDHFATDGSGSYVFRQPVTAEEEENCQRAIDVCPLEAVRDDGEGGGRKQVPLWSARYAGSSDEDIPALFEDYGADHANWRLRLTIVSGILIIFGSWVLLTWVVDRLVNY